MCSLDDEVYFSVHLVNTLSKFHISATYFCFPWLSLFRVSPRRWFCNQFIFNLNLFLDIHYVSYFPEDDKFIKEVKNFVFWLHRSGFAVEMLTDEGDLLTKENRSRLRELMTFTFRERMVKESSKVFIILSNTYLKLCSEMTENDAMNQNFLEEEKLVCGEIVQIRSELHQHMYRSDRFLPILLCPKDTARIPFWVRELPLFSWPDDKIRLLSKLSGVPEYSQEHIEL